VIHQNPILSLYSHLTRALLAIGADPLLDGDRVVVGHHLSAEGASFTLYCRGRSSTFLFLPSTEGAHDLAAACEVILARRKRGLSSWPLPLRVELEKASQARAVAHTRADAERAEEPTR
jgi:hypothetical protein